MSNIKESINKAAFAVKKHSPEIMMGFGMAGVILSVASASRDTLKAKSLWDDYAYVNDIREPEVKEVISVVWKEYIPTAVLTTATLLLLLGGNRVKDRRLLASAAMGKIAEEALNEYKYKVREVVGDKKSRQIDEEVRANKIDKNPLSDHVVLETGKGSTIIFDELSGRYFKSDVDFLKKRIVEMNAEKLKGMEVFTTLNQVYEWFDVPSIKLGYDIGWPLEEFIDISFHAYKTENDVPALLMCFEETPELI